MDSTKKIPIKMASVKDKWVSSGDISYKIGSFGIWILDYDDKDSLFRAGYPKDSQPIEYENEIREIIQKLKADSVKINLEK